MNTKLLIDGRLVDGAAVLDVVNPATGAVFAHCARADADQANAAVAAAKRAFPDWAARPLAERAALLVRMADAIDAARADIARLLTQEQGKPLAEATRELAGTAGFARVFATLDLPDEVIRDDEKSRIVQQRTPLGVVVAITPWNFPLLLLMAKLAPALLAGNTVVAKPAPTTPLATLALAGVIADIFPAGVVNFIVDDNDLGPLLTAHPDVAKISFTGSTATGKRVMASAASTLKRLTLELGGNDAAIVLDDVAPAVAAEKLFRGAMVNSGQVCIAIKRAYVPTSMYDAICDELAKLAAGAVVDDGLKQGTEYGPVQNRAQFDKLRALFEETKAEGKVLAGGPVGDGSEGFFFQPAIVRDIPDESRLVQEEQFGPILPVLRYDDIEDAIARANDTVFGLAASVWTADTRRGEEIARRVQAGTVWVNNHREMSPLVPFRGAKQSGMGTEYGREGLEEYTQAKIINVTR